MFKLPIIPFLSWPEKKPAPPPPKPEPLPLLAEPPPPVGSHILRVASDFCIDTREWANSGDRDAILASSGMGKSYLAGVIMEELIETGGMVFIIDPEGENYTLADRYRVAIVGGDNATVDLDLQEAEADQVCAVVTTVVKGNVSVIFDLSGMKRQRQQELFTVIVGKLFSLQENPASRRPIKLIVEEARVFAPQKVNDLPKVNGETCLSVFEDIATRGRKRGINLMLATQRPAAISKDILSQCNRWWFGGMKSTQDCNAMKPYLAEVGIEEEQIRALAPGEFFYSANGQVVKIKSRTRKCEHGGATPVSTGETAVPLTKAQFEAAMKKLNSI